MVLDNFIRGLSDEEIKSKVFAMQEEDCTPEKVLRFVEAEELGRSSVRDIRPASDVQQISGYMRGKMSGSNPPAPTPTGNCWYCKGNHPKENGCPEWTKKIQCKLCFRKGHNASQCHRTQVLKCYLCKKIGHTAVKCRLRSSDSDKAVTVGDQNAIEAAEADVMNISRRPHSSTTLARQGG